MLRKWLLEARDHGLGAQWGASIICAAISLALSVLLARLMGPAVFGSYAYLLGIGAALGIALDSGFRTLLLRERAAPSNGYTARPDQLLPAMLGHLLLLMALLGLASLLTSNWNGPSLVLCFAAIALAQWYSAWLKGIGDFHREARWQLRCRIISALLIVATVLTFEPSPALVFIAWALGLVLAGSRYVARLSLRPALPGVSMYGTSLGFAAVDLTTLIYHRADIILLYVLNGDTAEVGRYAAAYRLYDGVLLLAAPLSLLLFRRMRLSPGKSVEAGPMWLALCSALLLVGLAGLLGTPLASYLFGAGFTQGALVGWLFCALLFALPNGVLSQWAIAHHQERYYAWSAGSAALFNIALNIGLIPGYGALGAAWATIATEALLAGSLLFRWRRLRGHTSS